MIYALGVDIGTGSVKVIAALPNGAVIVKRQYAYPIHQTEDGHSEQDPFEVLAAVKRAIRETVEELQHQPRVISFSAAMHSIMMMDDQGQALTPLLIWADNRSLAITDRLKQDEAACELYSHTGTPLHTMLPLCKIIWWREHLPELFAACDRFIGIKEFILFHCFGTYVTDYSTASATGMLNMHTLTWHQPALQLAGIGVQQLPELTDVSSTMGAWLPEAALALGIAVNTVCVAGGTDGCLAQYAGDVPDAGNLTLTIGSSGAIRMALDKPVSDAQHRLFSYVFKKDRYVVGGAVNNGGLLLKWYTDTFLKPVVQSVVSLEEVLNEALDLPAGAGGLICLPYLYGERAPVWDAHAKACFIGVKPLHTASHFLRAMLEGMAYGLLAIIEALEETTGTVHNISVSGGFTASHQWIRLLADITGKRLQLRQGADASAMGAVRIGFEALQIKFTLPASEVQTFEPDARFTHTYRQAYDFHNKAYAALKPLFPALP